MSARELIATTLCNLSVTEKVKKILIDNGKYIYKCIDYMLYL